jgi:hypothetical protein
MSSIVSQVEKSVIDNYSLLVLDREVLLFWAPMCWTYETKITKYWQWIAKPWWKIISHSEFVWLGAEKEMVYSMLGVSAALMGGCLLATKSLLRPPNGMLIMLEKDLNLRQLQRQLKRAKKQLYLHQYCHCLEWMNNALCQPQQLEVDNIIYFGMHGNLFSSIYRWYHIIER